MTSNPTKDAERLARLRVFYDGCEETDSNQPVGIGHPVFLLRLLNERDATIARLSEANATLQRCLVDEQNNVARLTQERDEAIESHDAQVADLKLEIEDWRGRLATQCGETLAARKERDEARRSAEALQERLGVLKPHGEGESPNKSAKPSSRCEADTAQPSADDVERAREQHKTIPVKVWADVDEGIAAAVVYLNTIPGVRTIASCQGTIGEGGPAPYKSQVMASWTSDALARLSVEFDIEHLGDGWGRLYPRENQNYFLTAARREGAELRPQDDAAIEAAVRRWHQAEWGGQDSASIRKARADFGDPLDDGDPNMALIDALAARDAAIGAREGE